MKNKSQLPKNETPNLPKGWEIKKLGEVCDFVRGPFGGSLKKDCFREEGNAVYEQQHAIYNQFSKIRYYINDEKFEEMKRFELLAGDLIMSCSGTMGKVAIVPDDVKKGIINQALLKLTTSSYLAVEYLRYWMISDGFQESLAKYTVGAAIKNVASVKVLKQIEIPVPQLIEQKLIVIILDKAFAEIAKVKENAEQNLKNAKALFESYLQDIFENKGDNWEEKRFDEVCVLQRGFDLPKRLRDKGIYPLVSSSGTTDYIDTWKVKSPGVSTGRSGTIGKVHFIEKDYFPLNTSLYIKEFHGNDEKCIYYFLKKFDLSRFQSGAGVPTLNRNNVHSEKVYFPSSIKEQQQIVRNLDTLLDEIENLEVIYQQNLDNLEELKKSILQKAFNGEL